MKHKINIFQFDIYDKLLMGLIGVCLLGLILPWISIPILGSYTAMSSKYGIILFCAYIAILGVYFWKKEISKTAIFIINGALALHLIRALYLLITNSSIFQNIDAGILGQWNIINFIGPGVYVFIVGLLASLIIVILRIVKLNDKKYLIIGIIGAIVLFAAIFIYMNVGNGNNSDSSSMLNSNSENSNTNLLNQKVTFSKKPVEQMQLSCYDNQNKSTLEHNGINLEFSFTDVDGNYVKPSKGTLQIIISDAIKNNDYSFSYKRGNILKNITITMDKLTWTKDSNSGFYTIKESDINYELFNSITKNMDDELNKNYYFSKIYIDAIYDDSKIIKVVSTPDIMSCSMKYYNQDIKTIETLSNGKYKCENGQIGDSYQYCQLTEYLEKINETQDCNLNPNYVKLKASKGIVNNITKYPSYTFQISNELCKDADLSLANMDIAVYYENTSILYKNVNFDDINENTLSVGNSIQKNIELDNTNIYGSENIFKTPGNYNIVSIIYYNNKIIDLVSNKIYISGNDIYKEVLAKKVTSLSITCDEPKSFDGNLQKDGFILYVKPLSADNTIIPIEGNLEIYGNMKVQTDDYGYEYSKGKLVYNKSITISGDKRFQSFDEYKGYALLINWSDIQNYNSAFKNDGFLTVKMTVDNNILEADAGSADGFSEDCIFREN